MTLIDSNKKGVELNPTPFVKPKTSILNYIAVRAILILP